MPELPSDSTLAKIRELCGELSARHGLDNETREELCGHLEDKLSGYLNGEVKITEEDALLLVRAHFGNTEKIAQRLRREQSRSFFGWNINHSRVYIVLLTVIVIIPAVNFPYILRLASSPDARGVGHIPNWVLRWDMPISLAYLLAAVTILLFRYFRPEAARRVTRILNYLLLFAPPLGTLLGVYGLLKVDKEMPAQAP
jgi:hypothetical protein